MSIRLLALAVVVCVDAGCGGDDGGGGLPDAATGPTDVEFGETALVVVVNPAVNEPNDRELPEPGDARAGILLESDDGVSATTDGSGVVVLAPLTAGTRTVEVSGGEIDGSFTVTIADGELREIALAAEGGRAEVMVEIDYKSDRVTEIAPTMSNEAVNDALSVSDTLVFLAGGTYSGDLDFSGSRVTLFGEGVLGGEVTIEGNVTVSGSDSRIRGTHITGDLAIPASGVGLSFSRVDGSTSSEGSDATYLANALCGEVAITGSGSLAVGNAGVAPTTSCP